MTPVLCWLPNYEIGEQAVARQVSAVVRPVSGVPESGSSAVNRPAREQLPINLRKVL
jgi:hypothetical protein